MEPAALARPAGQTLHSDREAAASCVEKRPAPHSTHCVASEMPAEEVQ